MVPLKKKEKPVYIRLEIMLALLLVAKTWTVPLCCAVCEENVRRLPGSQLYCGLTTQTGDPLISLFNKEPVPGQYNCLMPFSYFSIH